MYQIVRSLTIFTLIIVTSCQKEPKSTPIAMANQWEYLGEAINESGYDIWGSSPVRDEQGNVHLFSARWSSKKPFISAWRFDSEIAHYMANTPEGPFKFQGTIRKNRPKRSWNSNGYHNPNIKKIDNKYVLVYIANDGNENHGPNQKIGMLISDNLNGSWSDIPNIEEPLLSPPIDESSWCFNSGCGLNNPSIIKHPNGKYYLYFKAMSGPKGNVSMGVAIAEKIEGPYNIQSKPITTNSKVIEDGYAFLWGDQICLLTTDNHGILEEGGGLLWMSKDGLKFDENPLSGFHHFGRSYLKGNIPKNATLRYTKNVKFERPQLLMNDKNEPEYLYCPSGAAIDGSDGTNCYVLKFKKD
jgi:hypothetical protein